MTSFALAETAALVEELIGRANLAMINTLNLSAEQVFKASQERVPKDDPGTHEQRAAQEAGYPARTLAESGHVVAASETDHTAQVVYEGPYAAAQEAGHMMYVTKTGKEVMWDAESYTSPGTGAHYLEDSGKMVIAMGAEELAVQGRIAFGILPGLHTTKSTLSAAGRRAEMEPAPGGAVAAITANEQRMGQEATSLQIPPSAPPQLQ